MFRLNFSHGTHEQHQARLAQIREVEQEVGRPIGVLADMQGPKLRVGTFAHGPVTLGSRGAFPARSRPTSRATRIARPLPHPEIFAALKPGATLLVDDGKVRLQVTQCGADFATTEVIVGGRVSDRKGVNVPDVVLPLSALTQKDRRDLEFALELGIEWLALSFVQRPEDLDEARSLARGRAGILTKLEKPSAVDALDEIVAKSDAVMVARGDLGVELPAEKVPGIQRRAVRACRLAGKPVIVATQMLESMIESPVPTRAEASDVATAIYHGADAVMLSAESASGKYPLEAVQMMDRIIREVESDPVPSGSPRAVAHDRARQQCGCDLRGDGQDRRNASDRCGRDLHDIGLDEPARRAGASRRVDLEHDALPRYRAAARARMGRSLREHERRGQRGGHGRRCVSRRPRRRIRAGRRHDSGERWHAVRHAGRD